MRSKKWEHSFNFNLDTLVKARAARYENQDWWDEIKDSRIEHEEEKDGVLYIKRRVFLKTNLPKIAEKAIPGGAFEVMEESWYNKKHQVMDIKAKNVSLEKFFRFKEADKYIAMEGEKSKRFVEISIDISVPLVGSSIEKIVCEEFKKQSDKDKQVINKYVASLG